jgi:hypothetical protein
MNLLCPNCGKMLTVPEQYAGQMMKCPLCNGTFTVPALPGGAALEQSPAPSPTGPAAVPATPALDPYHLRQEGPPAPEPAFSTAPVPDPAFSLDEPEPAFQTAPSPAPSAPPPVTATTTGPTASRGPDTAGQPLSSQRYRGGFSVEISDTVLRWVVPACLVLIFVFSLFPWVGIFPGGVPALTQNAWSAAFAGSGSEDLDLRKLYRRASSEGSAKSDKEKDRGSDWSPGWSPLLLLYLLPFFLVTLLLAIAVAVLPLVKVQLPPQVEQFLPWQWAALAGLNAVLLLFLVLQMLLGFGLENSYTAWVDSHPEMKKEAQNSKEMKEIEVARGMRLAMLHRTIWLRLTLLLQIVAAVSAGLVFWIERRGTAAPLPIFEVKW